MVILKGEVVSLDVLGDLGAATSPRRVGERA